MIDTIFLSSFSFLSVIYLKKPFPFDTWLKTHKTIYLNAQPYIGNVYVQNYEKPYLQCLPLFDLSYVNLILVTMGFLLNHDFN